MVIKIPHNVISIGKLSGTEILEHAGFSNNSQEMEVFNGKKVLDFGAGLSDLLPTILESSSPKEVWGIDPIFEEEMWFSFAVQKALLSLHRNQRILDSKTEGEWAQSGFDMPYLREALATRIRTILSAKANIWDDKNIVKRTGLEQCEDSYFDYIFINFFFGYITADPELFFTDIVTKLTCSGELIIIDNSSAPNIKALLRSPLLGELFQVEERNFKDIYKVLKIKK